MTREEVERLARIVNEGERALPSPSGPRGTPPLKGHSRRARRASRRRWSRSRRVRGLAHRGPVLSLKYRGTVDIDRKPSIQPLSPRLRLARHRASVRLAGSRRHRHRARGSTLSMRLIRGVSEIDVPPHRPSRCPRRAGRTRGPWPRHRPHRSPVGDSREGMDDPVGIDPAVVVEIVEVQVPLWPDREADRLHVGPRAGPSLPLLPAIQSLRPQWCCHRLPPSRPDSHRSPRHRASRRGRRPDSRGPTKSAPVAALATVVMIPSVPNSDGSTRLR